MWINVIITLLVHTGRKWQRTHGQSLQGTLITVCRGLKTVPLYSQQALLLEGAPLQDRTVPATGLDFSAFPLLPFPCSHFCATQPEGKHDANGTDGLALGQAFHDQTGSSSVYPNCSCETGLSQIMNHVPRGVKKRWGRGGVGGSCSTKVVQDNRF